MDTLELEPPRKQRYIPAREAGSDEFASLILELANFDYPTRMLLKEHKVVEIENKEVFMIRVSKELSAMSKLEATKKVNKILEDENKHNIHSIQI